MKLFNKNLHRLILGSLLALSPGALAAPERPTLFGGPASSTENEERVLVGNDRRFYLLKSNPGWEVGVIDKDGKRYRLLDAAKIESVSQFEQGPSANGRPWRSLPVMNSSGKIEQAKTWLFVETETGSHLIHYHPDSIFSMYSFPQISGVKNVNVSFVKVGSERMVLLAVQSANGGATFLVDLKVASASQVADRFIQLEKNGNPTAHLEGDVLAFSTSDVRADLSSVRANAFALGFSGMTLSTHEGIQARPSLLASPVAQAPVAEESRSAIGEMFDQVSRMAGKAFSGPSTTQHQSAPQAMAMESSSQNTAPANDQQQSLPPGANQLPIKYNETQFLLYVSQDASRPGTYLVRESDKMTVKVSSQGVPLADAKGDARIAVTVKDGILSHPALARSIDLEAFEMETHFKPRLNSLKNTQWMDGQFSNVRTDGELELKPAQERQEIVDVVLKDLLKEKRSSTLFLGGAGDAILMAREAVKRLPRTWEFRSLERSVIESETSVVGQLGTKIQQMREAMQSKPYIWLGENFDGLKGIGTSEGNSEDFLSQVKNDFRDGTFRVVGSGSSDFFKNISDRSFLDHIKTVDVPTLSQKGTLEMIHSWLEAHPSYPKPSDSFLQQLMKTASYFNVVEEEPTRSLKFLERIYSILESSKQLDAAHLNESVLAKAVREEYRGDPSLMDLQALRLKLRDFKSNMQMNIIGHEHLIDMAYTRSKNALAGLHDRRGPRFSIYIDGPPGTGKTEFALAYAKALDLRAVRIEMAQFKGSDQKTVSEFMEKIGSELSRDSFTVLILDELEKSSKEVQNALLAAMDNEKFTYSVNGRMRTQSMANASVIGTSNAIGDFVAAHMKSLSLEQKSGSSVELEKSFFEATPFDQFEDMVTQIISRPMFDRFQIKTVAFQPSLPNLVRILKMKLTGIQRKIQEQMEINPRFSGEDVYLRELAEKSIKEGWSTRTVISKLNEHVLDQASELIMDEKFKKNQSYEIPVGAACARAVKGK